MEYILKSSAIISIFYLFYMLFLKNETYFKNIRWFFLAGLLLSVVLPLVVVTKYVEATQVVSSTPYIINESAGPKSIVVSPDASLDIYQVLFYGYALGIAILLIQFLFQLGSLLLLLLKCPIKKENGFLFVETATSVSPFSFFNCIVYNPDQFKKEELEQIIIHEKVHVRHLHSIDTIMIQLFAIFQWFNPLIWLYRKELQQNLEFITDEITQQQVADKKGYQQLLVKTSVQDYQLALVNNFYNSLLKKRIHMLHKEKSKHSHQWKFALIVPLLVAFLLAFNTKTIAQTTDDKQVIKVASEIIELIISKKASREDLNNLKDEFAEKGLKVTFSGIKRNSDNEIIAIKVDAKADNGKSSASYAADNDQAIKPIKIAYDSENNSLSIGATHGSTHAYRFRTAGDKKFIIKRDGKGQTEDVIHIESDGDHDSDAEVHIWTSKDGKHKKMKRRKEIIVEVDDDGNETKKEIIKIRGKGDQSDFILIEDEDDPNATITYIVNGKKVTKKELKKMDKDKIKTLEVKKEVKKKKKN